MPVAPDAFLQDQQGRAVLRFERRLSHPPERVWKALTEPGELFSWHPTPFELEPQVGGKVAYLPGGDVPQMSDGEVIEYDPPRALGYTWDEDQLRWELRAVDEGCLLILTHTFDDRFKAARDAAGWHLCLDAMASLLDGTPNELRALSERRTEGADRHPDTGGPPEWRELNRAYEQRFGIAADEATPPPSG
jgi:uncharacterized protein YndB with AHSA1/START domain